MVFSRSACEILEIRQHLPAKHVVESREFDEKLMAEAAAEGCISPAAEDIQEVVIRGKPKKAAESPHTPEDTAPSQAPPAQPAPNPQPAQAEPLAQHGSVGDRPSDVA